MALTILELLSQEKPQGGYVKNVSREPICKFIQRHMAEIEEARARNYSWKQIDAVCRKLWDDDADAMPIVWWKTPSMIRDCYRAVKNGVKVHKKRPAPQPPLKFSVEVTQK